MSAEEKQAPRKEELKRYSVKAGEIVTAGAGKMRSPQSPLTQAACRSPAHVRCLAGSAEALAWA